MDFPTIRSFIWRLGRRLYCWARREASNNPATNGEYWLLKQVINDGLVRSPVFLDIGAHVGNWSERASALLMRSGIVGRVHAFEPTLSTYTCLSERFKGSNLVSTNRIALSDNPGNREFFVIDELCGTNSLIKIDGARTEIVATMRIDDFIAENRIDHVLFAKSDAEGHDLCVLMGAAETLRQGRVDVWQFEYNYRWVGGRSFLKDVFCFIADKPYMLGKLYGNGIETYDSWHPELERFFESNYVLIRRGSRYEKLCSPGQFNACNVLMPG